MGVINYLEKAYKNIRIKLFAIMHLGYDVEFTTTQFKSAVVLPIKDKKRIKDIFFIFLTTYVESVRKYKVYAYVLSVAIQLGLILFGNRNLEQYYSYFDIQSWEGVVLRYVVILLCVSVVIVFYYHNLSSYFPKVNSESKILEPIFMTIKLTSCFFATGSILLANQDYLKYLLLLVLVFTLLNITEVLSGQLLIKRIIPHEPAMVIKFFTTLIHLNIYKTYYYDSRDKKDIILLLENLAINLKFRIYQGNKTYNTEFNSWLDEYSKRIAKTVQDKEKDILIDNKSLLSTQKYVSKVLFYYLTGHWGKIVNAKNITVTHQVGIKHIAAQILKNFLVGILPIISIIIFEYFIKIPSEIRAYVFFGGFIWLLINLLLSIDPMISEKMKITREVMGIIEGKK